MILTNIRRHSRRFQKLASSLRQKLHHSKLIFSINCKALVTLNTSVKVWGTSQFHPYFQASAAIAQVVLQGQKGCDPKVNLMDI